MNGEAKKEKRKKVEGSGSYSDSMLPSSSSSSSLFSSLQTKCSNLIPLESLFLNNPNHETNTEKGSHAYSLSLSL
ncbi:hypothetical protein RJT34_10412 [Clitoria ternatea]|uniref:Uncharacterized protein n=1 Tax=Clitoria ternatea TaxID=43366 RepID=A0AAN9K814_CLITE